MPKWMKSRRTPIYCALKQHQLTLFAAGVIASGAALSPSAAANEHTSMSWNCRANDSGSGWQCEEVEIPGRSYQRPQHQAAAIAAAVAADQPEQSIAASRNLDWVEKSLMSSEQQKLCRKGCDGAYIEPKLSEAGSDQDPTSAPIDIKAVESETEGEVAILTGDVQVTQGYRRLRSNKAVINQETRVADLEGNIQLREPGLLLQGDRAHVESESEAATIDNATYVFHEKGVRGTSEQLERTESGHFIARETTYTSCPPDVDHWHLQASEVDIDTNTNVATARHVKLRIKDVPVMYIPWMQFPVGDERKSGLLYPSLEMSNENGIDFTQPYYLNLAPNFDATIAPRYVQERGLMLEGEFRHLADWGYSVLSGSWLSDDDGGDDDDDLTDPDTGLKPFEGEDRWLASFDHQGRVGPVRTLVDYTKVSDDRFFRDLGNNTLEVNSRTHLRQLVQFDYNTSNWDFSLKGEQFQTIFESFDRFDINGDPVRRTVEPYKQLPRIDANGDYDLSNGLRLTLDNHVVMFDHSDDDATGIAAQYQRDINNTFVTGSRARFDWGLEWDKQWTWGFFTPGIKAKHLTYDLDDPSLLGDGNDSPSVTVPVGYIDSGLFFERDTTWLSGFTQTFEPRLYLLYSKFEDQTNLPDFDTAEQTFSYSSLWRDDRFSGSDRIGDTKQASIGFTTRLLDDRTGTEILRAGIGRIFYFDDRQVSLNPALTPDVIDNPLILDSNNNGVIDTGDSVSVGGQTIGIDERTINELNSLTRDESPIAANLIWRFADNWRLLTDITWDTNVDKVDRGSFALRYNNNEDAIVNLGYRFTRNTARPNPNPTDPNPFLDETIEQADLSTVLPVVGNWSLIARWNYDFTNKRDLETFAGVEYESCCWRASLVARQWIDRDDLRYFRDEELEEDEGIFFQIQLKGLAGIGGKLDRILSEGIYGYQPAKY